MEQAEFETLRVGDFVYTPTSSDKWEKVEVLTLYNDAYKKGATVRRDGNGDKYSERYAQRSFLRREQIEKKPKPKPPKKTYVWMCHETGEWAETRDKAGEKFSITPYEVGKSNQYGTAINGKHYYKTELKDGVPIKLELPEVEENATVGVSD